MTGLKFQVGLTRYVFTCNLNMNFNTPWITSNCVKIVQNSVEEKQLKYEHKKCITRFKTLIADKNF